ncbi:hypothetical protein HL653_08910 [Sphingomonas sp. AP4-R1]|nr:hypothetical protein [Sphingomonas sp. AP4-R1]QJU56365.1 hypothetical protein HL653_08910 [Sphingomonas sp. AP4-R1]
MVVHQRAVPEGLAGRLVPSDHRRRLQRGAVARIARIAGADLLQHRRVGQLHALRQRIGPVAQALVERVEIILGVAGLALIGRGAITREGARGPALWGLARIDPVAVIGIHQIADPGGRADRGGVRIGARDRGDHPIGMGEIEAGIGAQRHDRGGGAVRADAGHDQQRLLLRIVAQVAETGGEGQDLGHHSGPGLIFGGPVAGVLANLERGDDHHADFE